MHKQICVWTSCIQILIKQNDLPLDVDLHFKFFDTDPLYILFTGARSVQCPVVTYPSEIDGVPKMSLPVFGLASYKFRGSLWTPNGGYEWQLANSLLQDAEDWLRERQVNHPDFIFFSRR